ncbi:DUF4199 domain-containing protein [Fulvivirga sedimenti]|uniref:DUF4199 domain-containing protein n=1 Tax=Fulvivirga sedimenti TaxID=2879465 RepID=A0A9X1HWA3_9BACT|nr:DUF4199 domain-containing protein [Fulvivirga sedimenti]MCA6079026.1 DUF4199 domain-containing protein [Fulvivirga sedimenti]
MKDVKVHFESVARRSAFLLALALIVYFLIIRFVGLAENQTLRLVNFAILAVGVFLSVRRFRDKSDDRFTYIRGLLAGTFTAVLASALFGVFIWAYLLFLDPGFMADLKANAPFGPYLNPYIIAATLWIEGIFAGMVFSFLSMMMLTNNDENI